MTGITLSLRIAGRSAPTRRKRLEFCKRLPASDACRSTGMASGEHSPAGRLLEGEEKPIRSVFVGACLQANRAGQQTSPHATNRQQAGSYKGKKSQCGLSMRLVFVGACLQAMRAGPQAWPHANNRQQAGSYKGKKSQCGLSMRLVFVGACLQAMRAGPQAWPHANNRRQAGSYKEMSSCFWRGKRRFWGCVSDSRYSPK
jgi:hypothetical protein